MSEGVRQHGTRTLEVSRLAADASHGNSTANDCNSQLIEVFQAVVAVKAPFQRETTH
jgi:hypothetical protein